jgi:hypothetical protein
MKIVKSFRISETTAKELEYLAKRWRISQADVIALLVNAAQDDSCDNLNDMVELLRKVQ